MKSKRHAATGSKLEKQNASVRSVVNGGQPANQKEDLLLIESKKCLKNVGGKIKRTRFTHNRSCCLD